MKNGVKFGLGVTLLAVVAIGGELLYLRHERSKPMAGTETAAPGKTDPDDLVFLKNKRPSSIGDLKELYGTTVWISAGGQMDYYPAAGKHADYAHPAGTLLGAEALAIKDSFEQVAPKQATFRIPGGDKQVLLSFTLPKSDDPGKMYAFPVGFQKGPDFTFFTDEILFYDDPHVLYKHWGPQIWQAVDAHQVILGMNEREVQLSLGQVSKSVSEEYGNRVVIFANLGHPMAVTFVKNKVTAFRPDQGF